MRWISWCIIQTRHSADCGRLWQNFTAKPRNRSSAETAAQIADLFIAGVGERLERRELCVQRGGDHVHTRVGALGGEPYGEKQFIILLVLQRAQGVGVELLQRLDDAADSGFGNDPPPDRRSEKSSVLAKSSSAADNIESLPVPSFLCRAGKSPCGKPFDGAAGCGILVSSDRGGTVWAI